MIVYNATKAQFHDDVNFNRISDIILNIAISLPPKRPFGARGPHISRRHPEGKT